MTDYLLAQVNIARLRYPQGDQRVADFFNGLEQINRLADAADGFVWRLEEDYSADPMLLFN
ncbi:MAG: DUF3291 domain-containing protein, partial [Gammaproteobacteria bacterium]|nr:DUF3291 domain-containing protein [Gammaproteobacteria bacterium]